MMRLEIKIIDRDTNTIDVTINCDDKGDAMGLAHQLSKVAQDFNRATKLSDISDKPIFMSKAEIAKIMQDAQAMPQGKPLDVRHPRDPQDYHAYGQGT